MKRGKLSKKEEGPKQKDGPKYMTGSYLDGCGTHYGHTLYCSSGDMTGEHADITYWDPTDSPYGFFCRIY